MELSDLLNEIMGTLIFMVLLVLEPTIAASKPVRWLCRCRGKIRACAETGPAHRFTSLSEC